MKSGTAHFRITGADFTRLVQERMLDDSPGAAYRLATSIGSVNPGVNDTVPQIAQRLCDGMISLLGDEKFMTVLDHDHKDYRKKLAWLHAGRIRLHDRWWQPIAYVADVGPMDVGGDSRRISGRDNRGWHYCSKDEMIVDHVSFKDPESLHLEREVIFRACVERPHWHQPPLTPQVAFEEYLAAGRKLEKRGHTVSYGKGPEKWPYGYAGRARAREPEPPNGGPNAVMRRKLAEERKVDELQKAEEVDRLKRITKLRLAILEQAGPDLIELTWEANSKVPAGKAMIPRAPFLLWAFSRLKWYQRFMPTWRTICPSGMKMQGDDPNHTDWVIGGGFDPQDRDFYWGGAKAAAADRLRSELQDMFDARRPTEEYETITTLVTGKKITAPIVHGVPGKTPAPGLVVVVPNLHTRYLWAVQGAAAVITEEGGEVAHLAQVAREQALPVVRADDALQRWLEGDVVEVDPEERTVRVVSRRSDAKL